MIASLLLAHFAFAATGLSSPTSGSSGGTSKNSSGAGSLTGAGSTPCVPVSTCAGTLAISAQGPAGEIPPWLLELLGLADITNLGYTSGEVDIAGKAVRIAYIYLLDDSGEAITDGHTWLAGAADFNEDGFDDTFGGPFTIGSDLTLSGELGVYLGDGTDTTPTETSLYLSFTGSQQGWGSSAAASFVWQVDSVSLVTASGAPVYSAEELPVSVTLDLGTLVYLDDFSYSEGVLSVSERMEFATDTTAASFGQSSTGNRRGSTVTNEWTMDTLTSDGHGGFTGQGTWSRYGLQDVDVQTDGRRMVSTVTRERGNAETALTWESSYITSVGRTVTTTRGTSELVYAAYPYSGTVTLWEDLSASLNRR